MRKHIGDYALFVGRHVPAGRLALAPAPASTPSLQELVHAGKESYYIVSQFNLFEYEQEAPLFGRLSDWFECCILGLTRCATSWKKSVRYSRRRRSSVQ